MISLIQDFLNQLISGKLLGANAYASCYAPEKVCKKSSFYWSADPLPGSYYLSSARGEIRILYGFNPQSSLNTLTGRVKTISQSHFVSDFLYIYLDLFIALRYSYSAWLERNPNAWVFRIPSFLNTGQSMFPFEVRQTFGNHGPQISETINLCFLTNHKILIGGTI